MFHSHLNDGMFYLMITHKGSKHAIIIVPNFKTYTDMLCMWLVFIRQFIKKMHEMNYTKIQAI
jgi:hypothetical protein